VARKQREVAMKSGLWIAGIALMLFPTSLRAMGTISMSSTGYPDSVVVEVTVVDDGSPDLCQWLAITRDGADLFYFERDFGNTQTVTFTDTDVQPNSSYCYEMALRVIPAQLACPNGGLCQYFECFCYVGTCSDTGPEPTFIGLGYLSTQFPDGSPIDNNEVRALLYDCNSSTEFIALNRIPLDAMQYLDTDTSVWVSGGYYCCWAQCVWLLGAEEVVPEDCVVRTRDTTWGRVKALYRE
jgi:hypothetical protein